MKSYYVMLTNWMGVQGAYGPFTKREDAQAWMDARRNAVNVDNRGSGMQVIPAWHVDAWKTTDKVP